MPHKPAAEFEVDEQLVRDLLRAQASALPGAADLPIRATAEGWDNTLWRVGDAYVARLPRRAVAAPLTLNEHRVLPGIAQRLAPTGVGVPAPLVQGRPAEGFPWPWSLLAWMDGEPGIAVPRGIRSSWAVPLARALRALHTPAEPGYPQNPFRGVPLAERAASFQERLTWLRGREGVDRTALEGIARAWDDAIAAEPWHGAPLWIHGDLHPGNLVARGGTLTGIIDFGDVTAGDPAYDLAVAWLAFDERGREAFVTELDETTDAATWHRARGWAGAVTLMLLHSSDDNPDYFTLGMDCLGEFN